MSQKWITITHANGKVQASTLDDFNNATIEFTTPTLISKIVVSDEPENPSMKALADVLNPPQA